MLLTLIFKQSFLIYYTIVHKHSLTKDDTYIINDNTVKILNKNITLLNKRNPEKICGKIMMLIYYLIQQVILTYEKYYYMM